MPTVGKNYILAIAIDNYADNELPNRVDSVAHTEACIAVLLKHYDFNEENTYRLYDENATEDAIENTFSELIDKTTESDNLIIMYNAASMVRTKLQESYWIPYNGKQNKIGNNISNTSLAILLKELTIRHLVVLSDSCFQSSFEATYIEMAKFNALSSSVVLASGFHLDNLRQEYQSSSFFNFIYKYLNNNREDSPSSIRLGNYLEQEIKKEYFPDLTTFYLTTTDWLLPRRTEEDIIWQQIREEHNKESYSRYISTYPDGIYSSEAYRHLSDLIAERNWQKAVAIDRVTEYERFSKIYHRSAFATLAQERVNVLLERMRNNTRGSKFTPNGLSSGTTNSSLDEKISKPEIKINQSKNVSKRKTDDVRSNIIIGKRSAKDLANIPASSSKSSKLMPGQVLCQIPTVMTVGKCYQAEIRIAIKDLQEKILNSNLRHKKGDFLEKSDVKISRLMRVQVMDREGQEDFEVTALSETQQYIDNESYSFWKYLIFPKRIGTHNLIVKVTAIINLDFVDEVVSKEILIWRKSINVNSQLNQESDKNSFQLLAILKDRKIIIDKNDLKSMLAKGKVQEVITNLSLLFREVDTQLYNDTIVLKQKLTSLYLKEIEHRITTEEFEAKMTRITYGIIRLIDSMHFADDLLLTVDSLNDQGSHPEFTKID